MSKPTNAQYRAAARRMYDGDDCDIDEDAKVNIGDEPGAYVQCWVWVPDDCCDEETLGEDESHESK